MSEITIEADSVEDALAEVAARLGPRARIVRADRVRRGGIAGFFAREVVEVVATAEEPTATSPPPGDDPAPETPTRGVDRALRQMMEAAEEASFAEVLGRTLVAGASPGSGPESIPPRTTTATIPGSRPDHGAPADEPTIPGVRWDVGRLLEAGLPPAVVESLAGLDPCDDLAHLTALATRLAPLCGPVPPGPGRLVGPRADRLAAALPSGPSGDWIHVVVGDEGAPAALTETPTIVSWVSDHGVVGAIQLAHATGATLGYGMASGFGSPARRVTALDAAWAVRELLERP